MSLIAATDNKRTKMSAPRFQNLFIDRITAQDIRFPTSKQLDGSDAVHKNPDYSCAYVTVTVNNSQVQGNGFAFTCGRGTEVIVKCIDSYKFLVENVSLADIFNDIGAFAVKLTNEEQLRWLGPEKGVQQMACSAILNALWDLWAKLEGKPLWKLVCDMSPEELLRCVDFRYITDFITPEEALSLLQKHSATKHERIKDVLISGIPAYITSVGWMGYSDEKIKQLCQQALADGFTSFKMKVGTSLEDDRRRAGIIRQAIGEQNRLMMDANQVWETWQAIDWMKSLSHFNPYWIEEPTSPDDIHAHAVIAEALQPYGMRVATGEHCHNRVMFKQFLRADAMQICQIDACRLCSVNENLAVMLMAAKANVPICPHAGGVGLCELVQHLAIINYVCIAPNWDGVMVEFADHLHEHFINPIRVEKGRYCAPEAPGYSATMHEESLAAFEFPNGTKWKKN